MSDIINAEASLVNAIKIIARETARAEIKAQIESGTLLDWSLEDHRDDVEDCIRDFIDHRVSVEIST